MYWLSFTYGVQVALLIYTSFDRVMVNPYPSPIQLYIINMVVNMNKVTFVNMNWLLDH